MKKILLVCLLTITACQLFAQTLPPFSQVRLQYNKDFKLAEPQVLQTANYILSTPIDQNIDAKTAAAQFLMKWMDGTTDYTFTLDENSTKSFLQNSGLMMVYIASMTKYAIQNKPNSSKAITINSVKNLLAYINDPANHVKKTDDLKALADANEKGDLESFLNQ